MKKIALITVICMFLTSMPLTAFAEQATEKNIHTIEKTSEFSPQLKLLSIFSGLAIGTLTNIKKNSTRPKPNHEEITEKPAQEVGDTKEIAPTQDIPKTQNTTGPAVEVEVERDVIKLVKPSIVYATMTKTYKTFKKGNQVEIVYDKGNGTQYFIKDIDGKTGWVTNGYLKIPPNPETNTDILTKEEIQRFIKIKGFTSKTDYFVWVDIDRQILNLLKKTDGEWGLLAQYPCSTGNNATPTKRGLYTLCEKGKSFGSYNKIGANHYIRYSGAYLIHSLPYLKGEVLDYTLGKRASHGCIRLACENAEWLYKNIPSKTAIWLN